MPPPSTPAPLLYIHQSLCLRRCRKWWLYDCHIEISAWIHYLLMWCLGRTTEITKICNIQYCMQKELTLLSSQYLFHVFYVCPFAAPASGWIVSVAVQHGMKLHTYIQHCTRYRQHSTVCVFQGTVCNSYLLCCSICGGELPSPSEWLGYSGSRRLNGQNWGTEEKGATYWQDPSPAQGTPAIFLRASLCSSLSSLLTTSTIHRLSRWLYLKFLLQVLLNSTSIC